MERQHPTRHHGADPETGRRQRKIEVSAWGQIVDEAFGRQDG